MASLAAQLCWLAVLGTAASKAPQDCNNDLDVLVLGAGIAGVKAAATLYEAGVTNFAVLEQSDRIGGRMWNITWEGLTIELGANWIEGIPQDENPVWTIAQKIGLKGNYTAQEDSPIKPTLYDAHGKVPEAEAFRAHHRIIHALNSALNVSCHRHLNNLSDISLREALLHTGWPAREDQTALERTLEFFVIDWDFEYPAEEVSLFNFFSVGKADAWHSLCNMTLGDSARPKVSLTRARTAARLGLFDHPNLQNFPWEAPRWFVTDPRGYVAVVEYIASPMLQATSVSNPPACPQHQFLFNKSVDAIRYGQSSNDGTRCCVETSDASSYCAKKCIVTFSGGVINAATKSNTLFYPPLPSWKVDAYAKAPNGIYTKIFLKYNVSFWDNADYILYADPKRRGYYSVWQNMESHGKFFPENANILMVTVVQAESERVEAQPKHKTIEEVQATLKMMYGQHIPEPVDIHIPIWNADPAFRGCWSSMQVGIQAADFEHMQAEVDGVFFAGEATDALYNGFTTGGYHSGEVVAGKVLGSIKNLILM